MEEAEYIDPSVLSWVEELRRVSMAVSKTTIKSVTGKNQLYYLLHWTEDAAEFGVTVHKGRDPESAEEWWSIDRALIKSPPFVTDEDTSILRLLWAERAHDTGLRAFGLGPKHGAEILRKLAKTGRFCPANDFSPLQP